MNNSLRLTFFGPPCMYFAYYRVFQRVLCATVEFALVFSWLIRDAMQLVLQEQVLVVCEHCHWSSRRLTRPLVTQLYIVATCWTHSTSSHTAPLRSSRTTSSWPYSVLLFAIFIMRPA